MVGEPSPRGAGLSALCMQTLSGDRDGYKKSWGVKLGFASAKLRNWPVGREAV